MPIFQHWIPQNSFLSYATTEIKSRLDNTCIFQSASITASLIMHTFKVPFRSVLLEKIIFFQHSSIQRQCYLVFWCLKIKSAENFSGNFKTLNVYFYGKNSIYQFYTTKTSVVTHFTISAFFLSILCNI